MARILLRPTIVYATLILFCVAAAPALGGAKVVVGRRVAASQRLSMDALSHAPWDALLRKYVDEQGNVDYTGWKRSAPDIQALDSYLAHLSQADPGRKATKEARLAMWINAYNAVTVRGILREYPTTSIRNHTARLYGYNIWKDLLLQVADEQISLEQIEHEILRKMGQPLIHFAIVCASHSCPKLVRQAYTAENLDTLLRANTRDFFANPQNFRYDARRGRIYLSTILSWFAEDFGSTRAQQLKTIAPYLPDKASQRAAAAGSARVSYLAYDWSLNDQKSARTAKQ